MKRFIFIIILVLNNAKIISMQQLHSIVAMELSFIVSDQDATMDDYQRSCDEYIVQCSNGDATITCRCGNQLTNKYQTIYRHIYDHHKQLDEANCISYICLLNDCSRKFLECTEVLHHLQEHNIFKCCKKFMPLEIFNNHIKICTQPLLKKKKFPIKNINKLTSSTFIKCIKCNKFISKKYPTFFHHVEKFHLDKKTEKYTCPIDDTCSESFERVSTVLYHMSAHGYSICCDQIMSCAEFDEHRKICTKPLKKQRKFIGK